MTVRLTHAHTFEIAYRPATDEWHLTLNTQPFAVADSEAEALDFVRWFQDGLTRWPVLPRLEASHAAHA